jgi:hypothetical protein
MLINLAYHSKWLVFTSLNETARNGEEEESDENFNLNKHSFAKRVALHFPSALHFAFENWNVVKKTIM